MARLQIDPADYSCRKRQRKLRTAAISRSQPMDYPHRRALPRFCCIAWFALFSSPGVLSTRVQNGKEWPPATLTTILVSGSPNAGGGFAIVTLKCSCALAEISALR
jgi:hypothetical protein